MRRDMLEGADWRSKVLDNARELLHAFDFAWRGQHLKTLGDVRKRSKKLAFVENCMRAHAIDSIGMCLYAPACALQRSHAMDCDRTRLTALECARRRDNADQTQKRNGDNAETTQRRRRDNAETTPLLRRHYAETRPEPRLDNAETRRDCA